MAPLWPHAALAALLLAQPAVAQQQDQAPADQTGRPLPTGLHITSGSVYSGTDWLGFSGAQTGIVGPSLYLFTMGATADVEWRPVERRQHFAIGYHAGYSRNDQVSVNGFDQAVSLDFRTDGSSRTVFALTATGQTGVLGDSLFDPTYILTVATQASSAQQLAEGLLGSGSGELGNSPLDLALAGTRRQSAVAFATITHSHSRRLTSFVHIGAAHEVRSYADQYVGTRYPNFTVGMADLGAHYSLSNRTRVTGTLNYTRSYSRLYGANWQSLGLGIERAIGRRSFGSFQAGYARMSEPASGGGYGRSSYTLNGSLGTNKGYHTLAIVLRRGVGDLHGLGADKSLGFSGAWSWAPHASAWTVGTSLGYERLESAGMGRVEAWMGQINAVRRLTAHFRLVLAMVYLTETGGELGDLSRRGARLSLLWTPGSDRGR